MRDEIKRRHENDLPFDTLPSLLHRIPESKQKNYARVINKYLTFLNTNDVKYFVSGKSHWILSDNLFIRTNPELGLIVNGRKLHVKNWYKKPEKNTKPTKKNINSFLTMMQLSERNFDLNDNENFAVLNLQNGKIVEASPLVSEAILELEIDAGQFVNIWNQV